MSPDPLAILTDRVRHAIDAAFPAFAGADAMVTVSRNLKLGDFQCNAAMPLAKAVGQPPRDIASALVERLNADPEFLRLAAPLAPGAIAGPGFINITLRPDALPVMLESLVAAGRGLPGPNTGPTVVVDLCGVNLAKQMHVGHLRSTVIGDTLARMLERTGCRVIRQNHVGDWGLPIAMVTARLMELQRAGEISLETLTLDALDKAYKAAQRECEADEKGLAAATRWHMGPKALAELGAQVDGASSKYEDAKGVLRKLQAREPEVMAVWQRISDVTMAACLAIAARLNSNVTSEHSAGESSYADELAPLVDDLIARGVTEVSEGALVIRVDDAGINEPLIVRKSDGAFLYATTDLAAILRRVGKFGASRVVYCVDARQGLHFKQVFAGARRAGYATLANGAESSLEHAAFGTILGEDGRPFKTRTGESVKLSDLIAQAEASALDVLNAESPDIAPDDRPAIARVVSIAALRYADLSTERIKDYVFSPQRMMSFKGNTGPYLLYAYVRMCSIFRKASERGLLESATTDHGTRGFALRVVEPAEKTLALAILRYPSVVHDAARTLEPSRVCAYAYELATAFSQFFDACPVITADDDATRKSRLRLCELTRQVLHDALDVLGIQTVERM